MTQVSLLENAAKNERLVVPLGLALVAVLGLAISLHLGDMLMMSATLAGSTFLYAAVLFLMWWTMMMAMMLPSAAPAILTYGAISRKFAEKQPPQVPLAVFVTGYATIWTGFAVMAMALQLLLSQTIALSMMMAVASSVLGGCLLIAAGLYQMTPLKLACLRKCQTPLMFFAHNWQKGYRGAFHMGLLHGFYCLGCCWVLMGLLFYGGVMELSWIVGLAVYVAIEKLVPAKSRLSQFTGLLLTVWGAWTVYHAFN